MAAFFSDPQRGQVPLGWAFDPNLADRVPQALVYAYRHATTNDFFIAGDSGAGYLNPRALTVRPDSKLPPALELWTEHCERYFKRWDMSITGFMLDGAGGGSTPEEFSAYRRFSPDGCGNHFDLHAAGDFRRADHSGVGHAGLGGGNGGLYGPAGSGRHQRTVLPVGPDHPEVAELARGGVARSCARSIPPRRSLWWTLTPSSA